MLKNIFIVSFILVFQILFIQNSFAINCRPYFGTSEGPLKSELENLLLNDLILAKVDSVREEYKDVAPFLKGTPTLEIHRVIRKIEKILLSRTNENEKLVLDMGIDRLIDDLVLTSPQYVPTRKVIAENLAIISAYAALENAKSTAPQKKRYDNVIEISSERFGANAEYLSERKHAIELIETYRNVDYIPQDVLWTRIGNLLFTDQRYRHLSQIAQDELISRVLIELVRKNGERTDILIERFLAREKVRERSV